MYSTAYETREIPTTVVATNTRVEPLYKTEFVPVHVPHYTTETVTVPQARTGGTFLSGLLYYSFIFFVI